MPKFVLKAADAERIVAWPVKIPVPMAGGKVEEQEIVARYRIVPDERMADVTRPSNLIGVNGDLVQLKECLVGFDELKDENGKPVPDDVALPTILSLPYMVRGLARGYWDMINGRLPKN